jgi:hypothetical protein
MLVTRGSKHLALALNHASRRGTSFPVTGRFLRIYFIAFRVPSSLTRGRSKPKLMVTTSDMDTTSFRNICHAACGMYRWSSTLSTYVCSIWDPALPRPAGCLSLFRIHFRSELFAEPQINFPPPIRMTCKQPPLGSHLGQEQIHPCSLISCLFYNKGVFRWVPLVSSYDK